MEKERYLPLKKQEIVNYAGGSYGVRISAPFFNETALERNKVYDIQFYIKDILIKKLSLATIEMGTSWGVRIPKAYIEQNEIVIGLKYDLLIDLQSKK